MPKVKFDVSDSDPDEATKSPEPPKPGTYKCKLVECTPGFKLKDDGKPDKTKPRLEVRYSVIGRIKDGGGVETKGDFVGYQLRDWLTFGDNEYTKRRLDQFLQAFGVATKTKRAGEFDTDKIVNKLCKVRVRGEQYTPEGGDPQYQARVAAVFKWDTDASDDGDDSAEDLGGDGEEDAGSDETTSEGGWSSFSELGEAADNDDNDAQELLTTLAEENDENPDDYGTWAELATYLEDELGLELPEGGGEESGGDEEAPDYDSMDVKELRAKCKENGLEVKGKKEDLIARLREFDGEDPF